MSSSAKLTVTVRSSRGGSTIDVRTNGRSVSTPVNTINYQLAGQPIMPTSSPEAYWSAVLSAVASSILAE